MGCFIYSFSICFTYLAAPGLSGSTGVFAAGCGTPAPRSGVAARPPALGEQSQPLEHRGSPGTWAAAAAPPGTDGPGEACRQSLAVLIRKLVVKADSHTRPLTHTVPVLGAAGALLFLRVDCPLPREDPAWHRPQRPLNAEAGSREQGSTAQLLLSGTSPREPPASLLPCWEGRVIAFDREVRRCPG